MPKGSFSGAHLERFGGGGNRPDSANTFMADGVVAITMLGVGHSGDAAVELLETRAIEFSELLIAISSEKTFVELAAEEVGDGWAIRSLYRRPAL
ncbi:DUF6308 family protein [Pengzhenrongella sp.]|jgi:hypothetical protein|uniref:DUF6308 family protein n=1 Tax=Pengzhenrongella sp. TaxID=2888820 RepID=UPI002F95CB6A